MAMALRRSGRLAGSSGRTFSQLSNKPIKKATSNNNKNSKSSSLQQRKKSDSTVKRYSKSHFANGPTQDHEREKWALGFKHVAGVDEAGRGPLVGPVVAAACILHGDSIDDLDLEGINDSKKMTEKQRESCYEILVSNPKRVSYAWHAIDTKTIDEINILQASMKAMEVAVSKLPVQADFVLVDGNRVPKAMKPSAAECIVKGDGKSLAIAAASVIAKVVRDRMMVDLDKKYPQYGFAKHKGYGVPQHLTAIKKHGPCPEHRRTFAPIKYM